MGSLSALRRKGHEGAGDRVLPAFQTVSDSSGIGAAFLQGTPAEDRAAGIFDPQMHMRAPWQPSTGSLTPKSGETGVRAQTSTAQAGLAAGTGRWRRAIQKRSGTLQKKHPTFCGASRIRTGDLHNAIVALYQLSYGPIF